MYGNEQIGNARYGDVSSSVVLIDLEAEIFSLSNVSAELKKDVNLYTSLTSQTEINVLLGRLRSVFAKIDSLTEFEATLSVNDLFANLFSYTNVSAALKVDRNLSAEIKSHTDIVAPLKRDVNLNTVILSQTEFEARLLLLKNLSAKFNSLTEFEADLQDANEIFAIINSITEITAELKLERNLAAQINSITQIVAAVKIGSHLLTLENAE